MGIHGLQLAGVLNANHTYALPTVELLGLYPTWENIIPQGVLLLAAIVVVVWKRVRDQKLQHKIIIN